MNIAYPIGAGQLPGVDFRAVFRIEPGATNATADNIVRHLIASGIGCFRGYRGDGLFEKRIGSVRVTQAILRTHLEKHCRFERNNKPCDPPTALVSAVQVSTVWPPASRPVMQEDRQ